MIIYGPGYRPLSVPTTVSNPKTGVPEAPGGGGRSAGRPIVETFGSTIVRNPSRITN